ncbi:MAG: hypothetical protein HGA75_08365 [Thiobacillus sp.]|nr:hypothetical protein [Thiobacillus sp.]
MKFTCLKLATVFLTSAALLAAGPAWSAEPAGQSVKKVSKAKPKVRKHAKVARKPVHASQEPVAATAASTAVTAMVATVTAAPAPAVAAEAAPAVPSGNPYLSNQSAPSSNPYLSNQSAPSGNPYLSNRPAPVGYTYQAVPAPTSGNPYQASPAAAPANPYQTQSAPSGYAAAGASSFNIRDLLPSIPDGMSILPTLTKVYPTGEKPLVVLTFHCPTELIGITPIPTKLLHSAVNGVFDVVNATDLLTFNLQQVCQ